MENTPTPNPNDAIFSDQTLVKMFRYLGWLEGSSFLILLLIAMPMKYLMGFPAATKVVGSIHGLLFVAYIMLALQISTTLSWKKSTLLKAFLAAVLPLGTFLFEKKHLNS